MYYFKVMIEKHSGQIKEREGVIPGTGYLEACDNVDDLVEDWGATLLSIKLFEVDDNGELIEVLTTVEKPLVLAGKQEKKDRPKPRWEPPEQLYPLQYAAQWTSPSFPTNKMEDT